MSRVRFEDGTVINFEGDPTAQDIDEAYHQHKSSSAISTVPKETQPNKPQSWFDSPTAKILFSGGGALTGGLAGGALGGMAGGVGAVPGELIGAGTFGAGANSIREMLARATGGGVSNQQANFDSLREGALGVAQQAAGPLIGKGLGAAGEALAPVMAPIKKVMSFPLRQTQEIQGGLLKYWNGMNSAYGDKLEQILSKSDGKIDAEPLFVYLKNKLSQFGTQFDPNTSKIVTGTMSKTNPIVTEMGRLYEQLSNRFLNPQVGSQEAFDVLTPKQIVEEMKGLVKLKRTSTLAGKTPPNFIERQVDEVRKEFGQLLEPFVGDSLKDLNREYAINRNFFNKASDIFHPFEGNTSRGETVLGRFHKNLQGTNEFLQKIEEELKIPFTNKAKAYSSAMDLANTHVLGTQPGKVLQSGGNLLSSLGVMGKEATQNSPGMQTIQDLLIKLLGRGTASIGLPEQ